MAGNPEYQDVHQAAPPPQITPPDSPSSPAGFAMVTPHGRGPAPYDIQAPQQDLAAAVEAAGRLTGAGVEYPMGPRDAEARALLESPQGAGPVDVTAGFHGSWPANVSPGG